VSKQQFWKANPNQMALPGMEELSHPGAMHLAQGYHFKSMHTSETELMTAHHPQWGEQELAALDWRRKGTYPEWSDEGWLHHRPRGEITWVKTNDSADSEKKGLATAMYGMARTMTRVKARHSTDRTSQGDQWTPKSAAKYGGPVPKNRNPWGAR
jgi:hypothetical protein